MTDTNCQRASQSLYETIAVSLFARLPPRALLAALPLACDTCSATFSPRIFEQKRDCSQSTHCPFYPLSNDPMVSLVSYWWTGDCLFHCAAKMEERGRRDKNDVPVCGKYNW